MNKTLVFSMGLFLLFTGFSQAQELWKLEKSEISYLVTHPLHVVRGKSLSAKGKGVCYERYCEFLIAVPVKSFDSGDNNRDLHMLEVTKAGLYPLIEVNAKTAEIHLNEKPKTIEADLEITFAGKKIKYQKISLDILEWKSNEAHIVGNLLLSLKAFDIKAPSLLTMPIQDVVAVNLNMFWKRMNP